MTNPRDQNRIAQALQYLRRHDQFFEFDDQERVVSVGISGLASADEAAEYIGNLRELHELTLYDTGLTDRGFSHLAGLAGLKELSIDGPGFTSKGLSHLSGMSELASLYFGDARGFDLAAFGAIAQVRNLRKLTLKGGGFSDADLAPLAALGNLERLSLAGNLNVRGTFCKQLIGLAHLHKLQPGEGVTDEGLSCIAGLPGLVSLEIGGPFTDIGVKELIALPRLERLEIRSDQVTADGVAVIATLPHLTSLCLSTPGLSDAAVTPLLRCGALERLSFRRSAISAGGLQRLRDGLPKCSVCDIQRDAWPPESKSSHNANRPTLESDIPFEVLLAEGNDRDLVNGTFVKIGALYGHVVDASQYTPEQRVIMLVWHSSGIIGNGGFEYLFSGEFFGDPDFHITAEAYRVAEIERSYAAFQAAFRLFPGAVVPHDPDERSRLYEMANRSARDVIDRQLWHDDHVRVRKLAEFIRKHAARLGDLDAS
jgi:hypothetical protein